MIHRQIARRLAFSSSAFSNSNRGFPETSNLVRRSNRSNIQLRRSSIAASAASDSSSSEAKRTGKKVSKVERRSMVESFVNKYRAMNSGKFPTTKHAQKEVGGSYYVVKKVLQELQYESKMSSIITSKEALKETEINKKNEPPTGFKDVVSSQILVEADIGEVTLVTDKTLMENRDGISHKASSSLEKIGVEISDEDQKGNEAPVGKEIARESVLTETEVQTIGPTMSDIEVHSSGASRVFTSGGAEAAKKNELSIEGGNFEAIVQKSDLPNRAADLSHLTSEVSEVKTKEKTTMTDVDVMKSRDNKQQQSPESEDTRDLTKEQRNDAEPPKRSFTWKHLKSLADGIINIWRKL